MYWIRTIIHRCCFFSIYHPIILGVWKQFVTSQIVVCKRVAGHPSVTSPAERQYVAVEAKWNWRAPSIHETSMVATAIGKIISATNVHWRLHMNGLFGKVPLFSVPLSAKSRGARRMWCVQHINWTMSDWGNIMFTDELRFTLQPVHKRKGSGENKVYTISPRTSLNATHCRVEASCFLKFCFSSNIW